MCTQQPDTSKTSSIQPLSMSPFISLALHKELSLEKTRKLRRDVVCSAFGKKNNEQLPVNRAGDSSGGGSNASSGDRKQEIAQKVACKACGVIVTEHGQHGPKCKLAAKNKKPSKAKFKVFGTGSVGPVVEAAPDSAEFVASQKLLKEHRRKAQQKEKQKLLESQKNKFNARLRREDLEYGE